MGAVVAGLRRGPAQAPGPTDPRAEELRRKLAEARGTPADEDDFEVAGMGAETMVEEPPPRPVPPPSPPPPPPSPPLEEARPPGEEFEAMRRRIHEEGRAAADEMRRAGEQERS